MQKIIILTIGFMIIHAEINGQLLLKCEGLTVSYNETFIQCDDNPWILVFEDEFEGNSLDLSKWEIQGWGQGALYGNNGPSQEYNTLDNVVVADGICKIIAKEETVVKRAIPYCPAECSPCATEQEIDECILEDGLPNLRTYYYTSANIWTKYKFDFGKFEACIKIPRGKGFYPAFWTFGGDPWNEIDIFEFWNERDFWNNYDPSKLSKVHHMNAWYDFDEDGDGDDCSTEYTGVDFSQDFHIFTVIWNRDKIEWYVDGDLKRTDFRLYTLLGAETGCTIEPYVPYLRNQIYPQDPMAIILNFAIQSGFDDWGNDRSPDNTTIFPNQMEIDWVKYYLRNSCQNVYISDPSQVILEDQVFNVIIGENITINCNFIINSGQQLDIMAENSLTLEPGFYSDAGSLFSTLIDPSICGSLKQSLIVTNNDNSATFIQDKSNIKDERLQSNSNIKVFPNPSDGKFLVDFGMSDYKIYKIRVVDSEGKVICYLENISNSLISLEIPGNSKGTYLLSLLNTETLSMIVHKIIIQ